jgi:hypothetical protein
MRDLTNVEAYVASSPLPEGIYVADIISSELTASKKGDSMVKVIFTANGRQLFEYFIIDSQDEKSLNMGLSKMKSLLLALGVKNFKFVNDHQMVAMIRGSITVEIGQKIDEYNGKTHTKNFIRKFISMPVKEQRQRPSIDDQYASIPF